LIFAEFDFYNSSFYMEIMHTNSFFFLPLIFQLYIKRCYLRRYIRDYLQLQYLRRYIRDYLQLQYLKQRK